MLEHFRINLIAIFINLNTMIHDSPLKSLRDKVKITIHIGTICELLLPSKVIKLGSFFSSCNSFNISTCNFLHSFIYADCVCIAASPLQAVDIIYLRNTKDDKETLQDTVQGKLCQTQGISKIRRKLCPVNTHTTCFAQGEY